MRSICKYPPLVFIVLLLLFASCEKEITTKTDNLVNLLDPQISDYIINEKDHIFQDLTNKYNLEPHFKSNKVKNALEKNNIDTLGFTIFTDKVKKIVLGNYVSFTFRANISSELRNKSTDNSFYNITIENSDGNSELYITEYTPTQNWLDNPTQVFQGSIDTMSGDDLADALDDTSEETDDNNYGGGNSWETNEGSPYYPTDCNGRVIITIEDVPYQCGCGHWPWQNCQRCPYDEPELPGYNQIPYYFCEADNNTQDNSSDNTNNNNDNNGGNSGTDGDPEPDDTSITIIIPPDEICELPKEMRVYDLDNNCTIDYYETCKMNNYSDEICDCVKEGGDIKDCKTGCAELNMLTDNSIIKNRLNQLKLSSSNFEKGLRIDRNPNNGDFVPSEIISYNNGTNHINIPSRIYTIAVAHTHPRKVFYKMFSAPDVLKLATMSNRIQSSSQSNISPISLTHILVFNNTVTSTPNENRIFALRFDDTETISKLQNIFSNKTIRRKFNRNLKNKYESDFNKSTSVDETDIFKQQKHLYKLFEEYGLNLSIYEADFNSQGLVESWKKIDKNSLEKKPCK